MSDGIFLIRPSGELVEMTEQAYQSEDLLQRFLENYPNLLPGRQIDSDDPRRWLLVRREEGIPHEASGADRWAVDHVFLDQDGIPTLVEVKRSSDTRLRREVVGQMLDYAANATAFWSVERLKISFERRCESSGQQASVLITELVGEENQDDRFWESVQTNLEAGKIRMIFVADEVPTELQKIVEFLNWQMTPAEVLAIEVRQFRSGDLTALVPRLLGQTTTSQLKKRATGSRGTPRDWDAPTFFEDIESRLGTAERDAAQRILLWAADNTATIEWGRGAQFGRFAVTTGSVRILDMYTDGTIYIKFRELSEPSSLGRERTFKFFEELRSIVGDDLSETILEKSRAFSVRRLTNENGVEKFVNFLGRLKDAISRVQSALKD